MRNGMVTLKFEDIRVNSDGMSNCRSNLGNITELQDSIKENGLLQALGVWKPPGKEYYVLCMGYRRHGAILALREKSKEFLPEIECLIIEGNLEEALSANLIENIQRKNVNHADLAERLHYLYSSRGMKETEIAEKVGLSQSQVSQLIGVAMNCIPVVLDALKKEWITLAVAKKLAHLSEEDQLTTLESLLDDAQRDKVKKALAAEIEGKDKPGSKTVKAKLKQVQAHASEYDTDYRKGVVVGMLYVLGFVPQEEHLFHPPENLPTDLKVKGQSFKTRANAKEEPPKEEPPEEPAPPQKPRKILKKASA